MTGLLLHLWACGAGPSDAALFAAAIDSAIDADDALATCQQITDTAIGDECLATLGRAQPALDGAACVDITDERWRGECWFTVSERRTDRWDALDACAQAGPFYDECLYHRWTRELSEIAADAPDATAGLDDARTVIDYWSGLQTIAGDPADQLWGDWWFFAHNHHRPASLAPCAALAMDDAARCVSGTTAFVHRAVVGDLLAPGADPTLADRICRSQALPSRLTQGLFLADPAFDAVLLDVITDACEAAAGQPVRRYNPVFRPRRAQ